MSLSTDQLREEYWTRLPRRGGFAYRRPDGRLVRRAADLQRIATLAIPPAWTDVYVSPDADAELQAFGRDAAGRLQYRYHAGFTQRNADRKWARMARFADVLPRLRASTRADLLRQGLPLEKVLALMTRLLHVAFFRVGSMRNLQRHRTYGLTTLLKRHLRLDGHHLVFEYRGKGGIRQWREARDATLARHVAALLALPGRWLFQYLDDDGRLRRVQASQLNAYLRERIGPFTAKDFRTWGGTLVAAVELARAASLDPPPRPKQVVVQTVRAVAARLGNTPAIARGSYICPVIIDRYLEGRVIDDTADGPARRPADRGLSRAEAALRRLLQAPVPGTASTRSSRRSPRRPARPPARAGAASGLRRSAPPGASTRRPRPGPTTSGPTARPVPPARQPPGAPARG